MSIWKDSLFNASVEFWPHYVFHSRYEGFEKCYNPEKQFQSHFVLAQLSSLPEQNLAFLQRAPPSTPVPTRTHPPPSYIQIASLLHPIFRGHGDNAGIMALISKTWVPVQPLAYFTLMCAADMTAGRSVISYRENKKKRWRGEEFLGQQLRRRHRRNIAFHSANFRRHREKTRLLFGMLKVACGQIGNPVYVSSTWTDIRCTPLYYN